MIFEVDTQKAGNCLSVTFEHDYRKMLQEGRNLSCFSRTISGLHEKILALTIGVLFCPVLESYIAPPGAPESLYPQSAAVNNAAVKVQIFNRQGKRYLLSTVAGS